MESTPILKAVKITKAAYDVLNAHAKKTKRTRQHLLTRAIERCYGKDCEIQAQAENQQVQA